MNDTKLKEKLITCVRDNVEHYILNNFAMEYQSDNFVTSYQDLNERIAIRFYDKYKYLFSIQPVWANDMNIFYVKNTSIYGGPVKLENFEYSDSNLLIKSIDEKVIELIKTSLSHTKNIDTIEPPRNAFQIGFDPKLLEDWETKYHGKIQNITKILNDKLHSLKAMSDVRCLHFHNECIGDTEVIVASLIEHNNLNAMVIAPYIFAIPNLSLNGPLYTAKIGFGVGSVDKYYGLLEVAPNTVHDTPEIHGTLKFGDDQMLIE